MKSFTVVVTVTVFLAGLLGSLLLLPHNQKLAGFALIMAAIFAALTYFWLYHVESTIDSRKPVASPERIKVGRRLVSVKAVSRIRFFLLEDENVIPWISRRHVIWLLRSLFLPIGLAILLIGVVLVFGVFHADLSGLTHGLSDAKNAIIQKSSGKNQKKPQVPAPDLGAAKPYLFHWPSHIFFPWQPLTLLLAAGFLVWGFHRWHKWYTWYFIITNKRLLLIQLPFAIFPFANDRDEPFPLGMLRKAEVEGSGFRNRWGLAEMNIATYLQKEEDAAIKGLRGLPHPKEVEALINKLTENNSDPLGGGGQVVVDELREVVSDLKEAIVHELPEAISRSLGKNGPSSEWPTQTP